jgi:glycosyltransferase involved in cell wall biosynthesis
MLDPVPTRTRPLRTFHLAASTDRRGAEVAAVNLARALSDGYGHDSRLWALAPGRIGGLDLPTFGNDRFAAATLAGLRREAARADVVVAHGSSTLPAVASATVGLGVPWVYRSIGDPAAWTTTRARRLRVGVAARRAAMVVALWRGAAVTWLERLHVPATQIEVIPNAADPSAFPAAGPRERAAARAELGLPADVELAVYLGALSPEKRPDLAVEAVAGLPGVHLAVVGAGALHDVVAARAAAWGSGRVLLHPPTDRPQTWLAAADVVVVPSDTEGQPAVAVEAGLSGRPVVATNVGGLSSVVDDGKTGVLVAPDDPRGLSIGIRKALDSRRDMGAAARGRCVAHFSIDAVAPRWDDLLCRVCRPR